MRHGERGVALITVLLISLLIMAAAGMLLLTTTMSATNAISATDEVQAYYAAEAGLQDALNVLRGNVAPRPNDGTKMNFKNAINVATSTDPSSGMPLSRWLVYNYPSTTPTRVTLSPKYTDVGGIAYSILPITDPDASFKVIYTTAGAFNGGSPTTSQSTSSLGNGSSVTYTPQSVTDITTNTSPALGTLAFSIGNNKSVDFSTTPLTFTLQVIESAPLPGGASSPLSGFITGRFSGIITSTSSTVSLNFPSQSIEIQGAGTLFRMPSQTIQIPASGTVTLSTVVFAPDPGRLVVKAIGYGPHGATKNLQMMISRFGINYVPPATFVIRGAGQDSTSQLSTISIGSSSAFVYSGVDNAGGQPLPAFLVTTDKDYQTLTNLKSNNPTGVQSDPSGLTPVLREVTLPANLGALPIWLQTTSDPVYGARAFVDQLRQAAKQQFYGCSGGQQAPSCDRYFNNTAGTDAPADFGASTPNGLFTFVDGDVTLGSDGGKGLLVVTGKLTMSGSQKFEGLVLVLGGGVLDRSGGGNGDSLGAFVVAKFDSTGGFLPPTFTSSGTGTSNLQLDRSKVKNALWLGGIPVLSVSEY